MSEAEQRECASDDTRSLGGGEAIGQDEDVIAGDKAEDRRGDQTATATATTIAN